MTVPYTCATDGRFKLVRVGGVERLHDVPADPLEQLDVMPQHPEPAARLRRAIDGTAPPEDVFVPEVLALDGDEDGDLEERLRLLGYL
jgi:hypothetical protein